MGNPSLRLSEVLTNLEGPNLPFPFGKSYSVPYSIVAQWKTIAHLGDSIMFGDTLIYDAQRHSPAESQNDLELDFKVFFFVDSCC